MKFIGGVAKRASNARDVEQNSPRVCLCVCPSVPMHVYTCVNVNDIHNACMST